MGNTAESVRQRLLKATLDCFLADGFADFLRLYYDTTSIGGSSYISAW